MFGLRWDEWVNDEPATVETWRGDEDVLARTLSGAALPVGQLDVRRYCKLAGDFTTLATLHGGDRWLLACRPNMAEPISGRPRRRRPIRLWLPGALCSTLSSNDRWRLELPCWAKPGSSMPAVRRRPNRSTGRLWMEAAPVFRAKLAFSVACIAAATSCWPLTRFPPRALHRCWAMRPWRGCSRASILAGRRQGGQSGVAGARDLASLLGRHAAGAGWRGDALHAQGDLAGGGGDETESSLVFLWSPWSLGLSRVLWSEWRHCAWWPGDGADTGPTTACWSWCGLRRLASILVLFNQPEWVEEYRPEEKPAVAVLWDDSASMETRDVEPAGRLGKRDHTARGDRAA